ncbi:MAG: hypothetical protein U5L00_13860 [Desulfovermiculus sp.]|nr:hypothetical protein [Desulfovermiculus sp.]
MMSTKRWCLYPLFVAAMFLMWIIPFQAWALPNQAPGDVGDLLLGDSYDVRVDPYNDESRTGAWENFIEIQNTSANWVAVHLRFRESQESLEVWDHPILLSPFDVFWAYMVVNDDDQVEIRSSDLKTLYHSGLIDKAQFEAGGEYVDTFSPFLIAQTEGIANPTEADYDTAMYERTQLGYLEAIGMWQFNGFAPQWYPQDPNGPLDGLIHQLEWDRDTGRGLIDPGTYSRDGMANSANIFDILANVWGNAPMHNTVQNQGSAGPGGPGLAVNEREASTWGWFGDNDYFVPFRYLRDCGDVLKGSIEMGDILTGQYIVNNFVALQRFRTNLLGTGDWHRDQTQWGPIVYHPDLYLGGKPFALPGNDFPFVYTAGLNNGSTYVNYPPINFVDVAFYLNPDWATTKGPTLRDGDTLARFFDGGQKFNDTWSLYPVEQALAKRFIWSFYLNDTPFRTSYYETDITMTFPTKHLHFGIRMPYWNDGTYFRFAGQSRQQGIRDYLEDVAAFRSRVTTDVIAYDGYLWDTNEVSPAPFKQLSPTYTYFDEDWANESEIIRLSELLTKNNISIDEFHMGQFVFTGWLMDSSQRLRNGQNQLPIIGHTTRVHEYELEGGVVPFRSASSTWHWTRPRFVVGQE